MLTDVDNEFVSKCERRQQLFGKFEIISCISIPFGHFLFIFNLPYYCSSITLSSIGQETMWQYMVYLI